MLRASIAAITNALTEALHKGDIDANRSVPRLLPGLLDLHSNDHVKIQSPAPKRSHVVPSTQITLAPPQITTHPPLSS